MWCRESTVFLLMFIWWLMVLFLLTFGTAAVVCAPKKRTSEECDSDLRFCIVFALVIAIGFTGCEIFGGN